MTNLKKTLGSYEPKRRESEKDTEKYLKETIASLGGKCYKQEAIRGMPDQMCVLPDGLIFFVETKSENDTRRKQQKIRAQELADLGQRVYKADTKARVDAVIKKEIMSF